MQPLSDVRVLDLGWHIAGPYCAKLLGDYGADVLKVERPIAGDPARAYGPFTGDEPHPERSGTFLHLNTNKRSVTVNLKDEAGKQIVRELAQWANVVVENFAPGTLDRLGLGYSDLKKVNQSIVMCSISNFGQTGPYREWKATDMVLAALAGLTYSSGRADREPLKAPDYVQQYQGGAMGAMAVMGAVLYQRWEGAGQHIDVSIHEVAGNSADRRTTLLTGYAYTGIVIGREGMLASGLPQGVFACKDGYVSLSIAPPSRWPRFMEMVGRPDLVKDPELGRPGFWGEPQAKKLSDSLLYPWLETRTKQQVMEEGQKARVAVTAFNSTVDALSDPGLVDRGYWTNAPHPEAGALPYAGPSFRMEPGDWQLRSTAPTLGEHNAQVLSGLLGLSPAELVLLRETGAI